jgi:hypothetical protein
VSAVVLLAIWPGSTAMGHLAVLAAIGLIIAETCLIGTPKLPFACSYLPGKSNIHITFWFCIALIMQLIGKVAEFELHVLRDRSQSMAMLGTLVLLWLILFWRNSARDQEEIQYEEVPADALVNLDIQNS